MSCGGDWCAVGRSGKCRAQDSGWKTMPDKDRQGKGGWEMKQAEKVVSS